MSFPPPDPPLLSETTGHSPLPKMTHEEYAEAVAFRRRYETEAIRVVAAIRDGYAPKLWQSTEGGQVAMWILDFAEHVRRGERAHVAKDREARTSDSVSVVSDGERIRADRDTLRAALQALESKWREKAADTGYDTGYRIAWRSCANDLAALLQSISESETP